MYQIYYVRPFSIEKGAVIYGSLLGAMIEADEIAFGECPNADIYLVKVDGFPFAPTFCFPVAARYLVSGDDVLKYRYHKCPVLLGYDYGLELEVIKEDGELWRYSNWVFPFQNVFPFQKLINCFVENVGKKLSCAYLLWQNRM